MADGTVIAGRYELQAELGRGGFGSVWRACDRTLGRDVAVKLVSVDHLDDPDAALERFRQEARAVAGFNHPNIVTAHDFGEHDGSAYLVMELITGGSLADEQDRARVAGQGSLSPSRVRSVADQVCAGLAVAHGAGLVHRDLKPANLMVAETTGTVKIVDFGIVWVDRESRLTRDGDHLGTLRYAAPEQLGTGVVDGRADLYSLGCVLYELLTGRSPYRADTPADWISAHLHAPPIPLRTVRPEVPEGLANLIHRLLAKEPAQRPANASDVRAMLAMPDNPPIIGRAPFARANGAHAPAATPAGATAGGAAAGRAGAAFAGAAAPDAAPAAAAGRAATPSGGQGAPAQGPSTPSGEHGDSAGRPSTPSGGVPSQPAVATPDRPATRPYTVGLDAPAANASRVGESGRRPAAFSGRPLPRYPTGPPPRNDVATAGLVCGILPLPLFGFVLGLVGVLLSRQLGGAGRVRGALGVVFALLWSIPIGAAIASELGHLSHQRDPGCVSVAATMRQFDSRLRPDNNNAPTVVELSAAAAKLRAGAAESKYPKTAADMRAVANDLDRWRIAVHAGHKPSAALRTRLAAAPGQIHSDCS